MPNNDDIFSIPYYITYEQMNVINEFRWNWLQLLLWTRFYLNSITAESESLPYVASKLYQEVPLDFYKSLSTFYGDANAQEFLDLISRHISLLWELIGFMMSNDSENISATTTELYQNANDISVFLARLNPFWVQENWRLLLVRYISLTIQAIRDTVAKNYERTIRIHDTLHRHTIVMGDYMSLG
ncbi:MAG: hypothetical protein GX076_08365 [Clostridiales bacterium]|nr:hypothetical protein [Clostridiales bacterium]